MKTLNYAGAHVAIHPTLFSPTKPTQPGSTSFRSAIKRGLIAAGLTAAVAVPAWSAEHIGAADRSTIFAAAARIATSEKGVTVLAAPPRGFNPLTASDAELLAYGLPQAPDKLADPKGFDHWQKAMHVVQTCGQVGASQPGTTESKTEVKACHAVDVKAQPYSSTNARSSGRRAIPNADGTTAYSSFNWSGIANTNNNTTWNSGTSFDEVVSVWNVPVPNHPFGNLPCSEGPWFEVTWNGIDGLKNGDVVQGGSADYWDGGGCGGTVQTYGWVEWYPSYSMLALYCNGNSASTSGSKLCPVTSGDDFLVVTYGAAGTSEQYVFVEDLTQQWFGTVGLTYQSGPGLVGNSAEYIVERPCCSGSDAYPLGNYVYEFFDDSYAFTGNGKLYSPGSTSASTAIISMLADDGVTDISEPIFYGTSGSQGSYSFWMGDAGCAYSGGCKK